MSEPMKRARLRFEMVGGNFMLSKLTDIETGLVIPISGIEFRAGVNDWAAGAQITITVPIEELVVDGYLTKILTEREHYHAFVLTNVTPWYTRLGAWVRGLLIANKGKPK